MQTDGAIQKNRVMANVMAKHRKLISTPYVHLTECIATHYTPDSHLVLHVKSARFHAIYVHTATALIFGSTITLYRVQTMLHHKAGASAAHPALCPEGVESWSGVKRSGVLPLAIWQLL